MNNIPLSQDELKVVVGILQQVQLVYRDSKTVNNVIDKLDSYIVKPQPQEVPVNKVDAPIEEPKVETTPEVAQEVPVVEAEVIAPVEGV